MLNSLEHYLTSFPHFRGLQKLAFGTSLLHSHTFLISNFRFGLRKSAYRLTKQGFRTFTFFLIFDFRFGLRKSTSQLLKWNFCIIPLSSSICGSRLLEFLNLHFFTFPGSALPSSAPLILADSSSIVDLSPTADHDLNCTNLHLFPMKIYYDCGSIEDARSLSNWSLKGSISSAIWSLWQREAREVKRRVIWSEITLNP